MTLTDNWQSTSMSQYRSTLSTSLSSHLSSSGAKGASADGVVGHAIIQVLTETGPETDLLRQILTDKSTPLMMIDEDPAGGRPRSSRSVLARRRPPRPRPLRRVPTRGPDWLWQWAPPPAWSSETAPAATR